MDEETENMDADSQKKPAPMSPLDHEDRLRLIESKLVEIFERLLLIEDAFDTLAESGFDVEKLKDDMVKLRDLDALKRI
jgi:hypothetical protein